MPARSLITTFSFLLWFSLSLASASLDVVRDRNGDPLVPGDEYFIALPIRGPIGPGVALDKTGNASSCEYSIIREPFFGGGMRVKFHVAGTSGADKIYLGSTPLRIEFVEKPDCAESSTWGAVASDSPSSSLYRLMIGDSARVNGIFQIQNLHPLGYKLVFCGTVIVVPPTCYDIGLENNLDLVVRHDNTGNSAENWWFVKAQSVKDKFSII